MLPSAVTHSPTFRPINRAYDTVFQPGRLSIGLVVPIETYANGPVPAMERHIERAQLADELGFSALWLRDVPFNVPSFGDAGQTFDPFTYLGLLAATTRTIALGVASIILPLRHPAHVAKAAATADVLSGGRVLLGIASGDRPEEYPALNHDHAQRGERFRDSYDYIRAASHERPDFANAYGQIGGNIDMLPKPVGGRLPLLITGRSQQSSEWLASNGDGWMTYPRPAHLQAQLIDELRQGNSASSAFDKPVMEPLYIDVLPNPRAGPTPIHLGLRLGVDRLRDYLASRHAIGVNHIALNLRFNRADIEQTLEQLAHEVLPDFHD